VPLNFPTKAYLRVQMYDASSGFQALVCNPNEADAAPGLGVTPGANFSSNAGGDRVMQDIQVWTSATGTVAARAGLATVDEYQVVTLGFDWSRR
jgi:hypothetical protein